MNLQQQRRGTRRQGMSLLEVIFAIAILGLSLAAIGRLVQIGFRAAGTARRQSEAQMLADATMAEIACGAIAAESINGAAFDQFPEWNYSVDVQPAAQIGLLLVQVTVEQQAAENPLRFSIMRFMPDPNFDFNESTDAP